MPHLLRRLLPILCVVWACAHAAAGAPVRSGPPEQPTSPTVVFLLHGIGKGPMDMLAMEIGLRRRGFEVVNWGYNSVVLTIPEAADELARALGPWEHHRVHFVVHSMGGIVVRAFLQRHKPANAGRLVMIGTPNHGAAMANMLGDLAVYRAALGPAGQQLRRGGGFIGELETPACEFAVIAGGTGQTTGMLALLPGDNDGIVEVDSARLDGMADFLLLPYAHTLIQMMPRTVRETAHFLRHGRFAHEDAVARSLTPWSKVRRSLSLDGDAGGGAGGADAATDTAATETLPADAGRP